jgi:hypothetical protein
VSDGKQASGKWPMRKGEKGNFSPNIHATLIRTSQSSSTLRQQLKQLQPHGLQALPSPPED